MDYGNQCLMSISSLVEPDYFNLIRLISACCPDLLQWSSLIRERENGEGGGELFEGSDYFNHFGQREVIIPGRQSIDGQLLFKEIWYMNKSNMLQCLQMSRRKEHINKLCGDWGRGSRD